MRILLKVAGLSCRSFSVAWGSLPQFALNSTDVVNRGAGCSAGSEFNLSSSLPIDAGYGIAGATGATDP